MSKLYVIKSKYTGKEFVMDRARLEEFCNSRGIRLNTLERAKRENRQTLTGWDLIDPSEIKSSIQTAVVVGDIHFCYEDKDSVNILYQILEDIRDEISEYIDLGDGVNNDALSKYQSVEDKQYTLYEEIEAYRSHMLHVKDILHEDTKYIVTEDNHFHLRKKRFLSENPAFRGLIPDLSDIFNKEIPHAQLYFPFGQDRFGCIHGVSFAKYFTRNHLDMYGRYDVICGHTHTMQSFVSSSGTINDEARRSYGIPSMCKRMSYVNGIPTRQMNGFAVITYDENTNNYNIEYIIVEKGSAMFRGKIYNSNIIKEELV